MAVAQANKTQGLGDLDTACGREPARVPEVETYAEAGRVSSACISLCILDHPFREHVLQKPLQLDCKPKMTILKWPSTIAADDSRARFSVPESRGVGNPISLMDNT
jgi:hypothetical protein